MAESSNILRQHKESNPVVASLPKRSPHPISSVSLSPDHRYAVTASKDTLQFIQIDPFKGLIAKKSFPIAHHFQTTPITSNSHNVGQMGRIYEDVRNTFSQDPFNLRAQPSPTAPAGTVINVVITDVAWSGHQNEADETSDTERTWIAAAGSNGVIVVWHAEALLWSSGHASIPPEAILSQHVRAVNRLAWHPTRPGILLSASQDATALLWERRIVTSTALAATKNRDTKFNLFGGNKEAAEPRTFYSWQYRIFEPKNEAVRDIQWSPHFEDSK
jgi:WD40 repeat protein